MGEALPRFKLRVVAAPARPGTPGNAFPAQGRGYRRPAQGFVPWLALRLLHFILWRFLWRVLRIFFSLRAGE